MGPLDASRPWQTGDVVGVAPVPAAAVARRRRRGRPARSRVSRRRRSTSETARLLHRTIDRGPRPTCEALRYNTAIAQLIELTNHADPSGRRRAPLPRALAEPLVLMTAPLAPHIAEELWSRLGHPDSLAYTPFPVADPALVAEATVELPVQVNGKVRFTVEVPAGASEDEVRALVTGSEEFGRWVDGGAVQRIIVVPGRIVNVVARPA